MMNPYNGLPSVALIVPDLALSTIWEGWFYQYGCNCTVMNDKKAVEAALKQDKLDLVLMWYPQTGFNVLEFAEKWDKTKCRAKFVFVATGSDYQDLHRLAQKLPLEVIEAPLTSTRIFLLVTHLRKNAGIQPKVWVVGKQTNKHKPLTQLFETRGCKVTELLKLDEVEKKLRGKPPDFVTVWVDSSIKKMMKICEVLVNHPATGHVPIAMIAETAMGKVKSEARKLGVYDYFIPKTQSLIAADIAETNLRIRASMVSDGVVAIVDPDSTDRQIFKRFVASIGLKPVCFEDAESFVAYLENDNRVDAVITELTLPKRNGFALIKHLRMDLKTQRTPILICTKGQKNTAAIRGFLVGAQDYFRKPVQRDELAVRLHSHLQFSALEADVRDKNRRLEELDQIKNEFLGIVAHDLRNPLHSIKNIASIFEKMKLSKADSSRFSALMHYEIDVMLDLINQLLSIHEIESGNLNLVYQAVEIGPFLKTNFDLHRLVAQKKNIKLALTDKTGRKTWEFDRNKISQVIDNFVSNAIKYSLPKTTVKIVARIHKKRLRIEIIDEGLGIDDTEKHNVFTKFSKLSNRPTGQETSVGLGLSICKKVIEAHKGDIGFTSKKEHGSTFYFEIPARSGT